MKTAMGTKGAFMKTEGTITKMKVFITAAALAVVMLALPGTPLAQTIEVGVAWQGKAGMAERVFGGFERAVAEKAPQIKLEIRKALPDMAALEDAVADYEKNKQAMVILRSNGAKMLGKRNLKIPTFIGGCNDPVALGVAKTLASPMENLTGVTFYIPAGVKLETFLRVYPAMKNYLLLVEKGHPGSPIDAQETASASSGLGLTGETVVCGSLGDALDALNKSAGDVSVILGSQALLLDNAGKIVQAAGSRPVFSYSERPVEVGALAGVVQDDDKLGYMLGDALIDVLINGRSMGEMPIQTDPEPKLYLNAGTIQMLKLQIPYDILNMATIVE
ncbi:MAG: hypothetical protein HQK66_02655 [Desulfamplus sp.]|nr:hypothetical protein [Desulfamplus sp.]